ncbi:RNA polymerase sigma-70 factor, ECF subfamily [Chitinophaga jiangningensis]|uniref:RNA polymerase sigma-70 factor, ECF subfamily n=1 Tax=Chitinophaga jiangningensis TaxID=1419482 RepID=A0A1M7LT84_9BACT|nr:sigma-70 family RNA polymerase sigma factor [Chitinophaga jiangningensis]SHM80920.1 RNA polymerase sigma-70 factor, ECF subfamily [Chitinophaga jiangningensis]
MTIIQPIDTFTDNELIARVLAGEKRLYEQLMRRHNTSLFRLGMSFLNNDMDVEDVMQLTYINAYQHLDQFRQDAAFGTWLKRILINECHQHLKRMKKTASEDLALHQDIPKTRETPVDAMMNKELGKVLENALLSIPEKYRAVFVLREIDQLNVAETSKALDISKVNVKVRQIRAKLMLREHISKFYQNDVVFPFHLIRCDRIVYAVLDKLEIK